MAHPTRKVQIKTRFFIGNIRFKSGIKCVPFKHQNNLLSVCDRLLDPNVSNFVNPQFTYAWQLTYFIKFKFPQKNG